MKILIINNLYHPFNKGGAEVVANTIYEQAKEKGHKPIVISTKPPRAKLNNSEKGSNYYINSLYYNLDQIPVILRLFWHIWNILNFINYFRIKKIIKEESPDIIMTHNMMGVGTMPVLATENAKAKHIHFLHDIQLLHPSGLIVKGEEGKLEGIAARIYRMLNRIFIGSPEIVISPSSWLLDEHAKRDFFQKSKKKIIKNPSPRCKGGGVEKKKDAFKIIYAGQLEEHKGIKTIINAAERIKNEIPESEIIIVGGGRYKNIIQEQKNIKYAGRLKREETLREISSSHILLLPSICYENSPTVIYEAFMSGTPVVATSLGGVPELMEMGAGAMFDAGDEDDMVEKIKWVRDNYRKTQKKLTRKNANKENQDISKYFDKIIGV